MLNNHPDKQRLIDAANIIAVAELRKIDDAVKESNAKMAALSRELKIGAETSNSGALISIMSRGWGIKLAYTAVYLYAIKQEYAQVPQAEGDVCSMARTLAGVMERAEARHVKWLAYERPEPAPKNLGIWFDQRDAVVAVVVHLRDAAARLREACKKVDEWKRS